MLGYGWINEVFECYFTENLIGLYLDDAINSVNVVDCNFEENYGVGLLVNSGEMVRAEGNEFESQGGPGIIANKVGALTVRSNYFEANNVHGNATEQFSYLDHHSGRHEEVCTHILLNGDPEMGPERSAGAHPLVTRIEDPTGRFPDGQIVLAPILLSNVAPCTGVVIEANFHAPGADRCPGTRFSGVFAAGAQGLHAMASTCTGCNKHDLVKDRVCVAVESGNAPGANASLVRPNAVIELNTGDFAE